MAVIDTPIQKESRDRYLTYALSVVSGRALPDVRDGLKPVQRRILYAMYNNLRLHPTGVYRKSAAVVGEVLARFHPHGDVACYEAMVRMAQEFSLRYPLVDGQGNFGSLDGDAAAAYRYTEARLKQTAIEVLGEIDEDTVVFRDNFDSTTREPVVLPSRLPNLLVNGASGIAVGMATSIPPHNLRDVVKALMLLLDDPEVAAAKLSAAIKAPDFPTGCAILNTKQELAEIYRTGRGGVRMRAEWLIEEQSRGQKAIIVTSIPYNVNKSQLIEKIAALIIGKKLPQLVDVRDESTDTVRVVMELASQAGPEEAMAYLFKHTPLETNFSVNMTALVPARDGSVRPDLLSLKSCLQYFLNFREEIVQNRLRFERGKLEARLHILEGLAKVFDALDEAIRIVRKSDGRTDAANKIGKRFKLTEVQAFAVVDMRIYQLSKTNIDDIRKELAEKTVRIKEIEGILAERSRILALVRADLEALAGRFGDKRRCKLISDVEEAELEFKEEAYVVHEDVYAIVTRDGWVKRVKQTNELNSTRIREGDRIVRAFALSTLDAVAFLTNLGYLYTVKVADFPSSSGYGSPIQKLLRFRDNERLVASFGVENKEAVQIEAFEGHQPLLAEGDLLLIVSKRGIGFAASVEGLSAIKRNGKRIAKPRDGDELAGAALLQEQQAFFTRQGAALVLPKKEVPVRSGASVGVLLMGVRQDDDLVALVSFGRSAIISVQIVDGKEREVDSKTLLVGHRGLKGRKVGVRGEILSADLN